MPDALGVLWVMAGAGAVLAPALAHGSSLGPFDLLSQYGLTKQHGVGVHNFNLSDQITAAIPWTTVAWTQVHHGQLPLWNPYSALGLPLAFNWLSASFSIPSLLGYLFPLHLAYTVQVATTLAIAGTGVYTLGRVLRLGVLGCVTAAIVFELSGPFIGWLGSPVPSVFSWAGWWFAAAILIVRGGHRIRNTAFFAVVLACMIYAGYPEAVVLIGLALVVFLAVLFGMRVSRFGGSGPILRPAFDIVIATLIGTGLAAPLALPGFQVVANSRRTQVSGVDTLSAHDFVHVALQGFDGLPIPGGQWFNISGQAAPYQPSVAYVGVIALVLAATALGLRRKRPEIVGFGAIAVAMTALAFSRAVASVMVSIPLIGTVYWNRALMPMAFAVAVLAGVGMDVLVRSHAERAVCRWLGAGFVVVGLALLALWVFGRGHLPPAEAAVRAHSFTWPAVQTALGLAVVVMLITVRRTRMRRASVGGRASPFGHLAAMLLVAGETVFLITAGAPMLWSSSQFLVPTPGVVALQRDVGSSVVGFGVGVNLFTGFPSLGILPNANDAFHVHEIDAYDPLTPREYYGNTPSFENSSAYPFGPAVTTAVFARRYGIAFVLEPDGAIGPQGAVFDAQIGDERLYRIPGAASATLSPSSSTSAFPAVDAPGRAVPVTHSNPENLEDHHPHGNPAGIATSTDRRPRLARHHRRAATEAPSIFEGDVPSSNTSRQAHCRAELLADSLHGRNHPRHVQRLCASGCNRGQGHPSPEIEDPCTVNGGCGRAIAGPQLTLVVLATFRTGSND